jgi:hypothetical protein
MTESQLDVRLGQLGPLVDVDSHEQVPVHLWESVFGEEVVDRIRPLVDSLRAIQARHDGGASTAIQADDADIDPASVWDIKGPRAPSAIDVSRRADVLDAMGIDRQFVFPSFALYGISMVCNEAAPDILRIPDRSLDLRAAGLEMIAAQNEWARSVAGRSGRRVRPVAIVLQDTISGMIEGAASAIDGGAGAVWIPSGIPPAGTSPADPALDGFWDRCASAGIPVVLHAGTEFGLVSPAWHANVPEFEWGVRDSIEFPVEPYRASASNLACENFLGAMIMGGVFERHPTLRFGVIEVGAYWVGPLAEKLDLWSTQFVRRLSGKLSMPPSGYIDRNVRVTPFVFEPVAMYFERYPQLSNVYCFSSDYPHIEGGQRAHRRFAEALAPMGDDIWRKYFVDNGTYLLPSAAS